MRSALKDQGQPRTVAGRVGGAGNIISGTGFNSTRTAPGVYLLRFYGARVMSITAIIDAGVAAAMHTNASISGDSVSLYAFGTNTGTNNDYQFTFTAVVAA